MKRQFAFVALMLATAVAIAKPVDPATARQAAERFLGRAVVNVTPKDITECYIFNAVDGHGFVLLAADDCVTPLLGYSEEDPFGVEEMPCNLSAWMDSYRRQIAEARAQGLTASSEVASEWRGLLSGVCSPKDGNEGDVDPLLTSKWNQSPRYNNRCPYDSVRQAHTLVGCVATAVSQVMRYWQHPVQPRGSHSYQWRKGSGVIGVNYDTSTYDFTLMPDELKASSSAEQIDAVAKLCFEVGASMDMNYGVDGSGAYEQSGGLLKRFSAELALENLFGYNPAMYAAFKEGYTLDEWKSLIGGEIRAGRPVVYTGSSSSGGHAFVLDGVRGSRYHINWGWGGQSNGYFLFGHLAFGMNGSTSSFDEMNNALIGVYPIVRNETTATVEVVPDDPAHGTVKGSGTYSVDSPRVLLYATAAAGYRFDHWTSGNHANPIFYFPTLDYRDTAVFVPLSADTLGYCMDFVPNFDTLYSLAHTEWGIRIPADRVPAGKELRKVQNFIYTTGDYRLRVYQGERPEGTPLYDATLNLRSYGWRTIELDHPVTLDASQPLWITFATDSVKYPAGITPNTGNPDGTWIMHDGVWEELDTVNLAYVTWSIRGIAYDPSAGIAAPVEDDFYVAVDGHTLTVVADQPVTVFDLQGRRVCASMARGLQAVMPAAGVYVVRAGESSKKIIVQ